MADSLICDEILVALERGSVTVQTHGELRHVCKIHGSSKDVKRALGSLINRGEVIRHRPIPQGCSDQLQPITFSRPDSL